jgi:tRNA-intron endonuclease, archaea type
LQKPVAELLDDNRFIIWDIKQARELYNNGFYGKPLGDPRPREDFEDPLLLDPVEAQYLVEYNIINIHKNKSSLNKKKLRKILENNFIDFNKKFRVYEDLRNRGYVVTPGIKYGSDFAVYEDGPGVDHAPYIVQIIGSEDLMSAAEIVKAGRLATTVRKSFILAVVNEDIRYLEFNWWKA